MTARSSTYRNFALAALVAMVYAACYSAIRIGMAFAPPFGFAGLRALVGGAALLALLALRGEPLLPPPRLWPAVAALAGIGTLLGFGAMFMSQRHTGAGLASVLGNTGPLMVIVLAAAFLSERVTFAKSVALAIGTAGVSLIAASGGSVAQPATLVGTVLPLGAALAGAAESIIVKRARIAGAVLSATAWQFLAGSLPLLLISAVAERGARIEWTLQFWGVLLFLAVPGTAFATALWYWLVQREEVGRLTLVLFLVPVIGLALGASLFAESLTPLQGGGAALALAACAMAMWNPTGRPSPVGPSS